MGSDAEVYIFDEVTFQEIVVPTFHKLLFDGSFDLWLKEIWDKLNQEGFNISAQAFGGVDFEKNCHYLNPDFSYTDSEKDQWTSDWDVRACTSVTCPDKEQCPLHTSNKQDAAEELNILFEAAISARCLGQSQFVGRSMSPMKYGDVLAELDGETEQKVYQLLRLLEFRGFIIGDQFANSDGIHGWLSAKETGDLVDLLQNLDLPQFEISFEAMVAFRVKLHNGLAYKAPSGYSFKHLSLAFLRTVGTLAVEQDKGILWGNDILGP
jgi:hypothetical protein